MFRKLAQRFKAWEKALYATYHVPADTPEQRARIRHFAKWHDHGFLRVRWHNFDEFAPGAYRSNHPDEDRIEDYRKLGLKMVVNLRGGRLVPASTLSDAAFAAQGIKVVTVGMGARSAPHQDRILELLDVFDAIEKPFLMHCKSGADRTGLAAAIYLLEYMDAPFEVARKQLSFKYLHIRRSKTGVLDAFLEAYGAARAENGVSLREWVSTAYDVDALRKAVSDR